MAVTTIDAKMLSKMFLAGANNLNAKKEWINELNVFPVPDGDTGTNMTMTIMSASREVSQVDQDNMKAVCKAISSGSLRGARGNSGVILSQLLRGFTKSVSDKSELTVEDLSAAFEKAVETAYKAVMKPKEGTILTVAKGGAVKAKELASQNVTLEVFIDEVIKHMDAVLEQTPEMLPVLKQAGVVDSGGQGLMEVLKGAQDAYLGKELNLSIPAADTKEDEKKSYDAQADVNIKYAYATAYNVHLNKEFNAKTEKDFKTFLESIGDSIVLMADDEVVKVQLNTNDPGFAIQRALKYGQLTNLKVCNLRLEKEAASESDHESISEQESTSEEPTMEHKDTAFIAVCAGDGLAEIFRSLGVDYVIEGGQTMNPSTEDILNAVDKVNADHIIILPNNKNIILAANQAQSLVEDKKIYVVPTKTIPQGITAVINFVPDLSAEENVSAMTEEITAVKSGEVTYAVRDTQIDDKVIKQGDFMGIGDSGILAVTQDRDSTTVKMLENMITDDTELISIYYGSDVTESDAQSLADVIRQTFADCDVELQYGGQPIYYYIVSAE